MLLAITTRLTVMTQVRLEGLEQRLIKGLRRRAAHDAVAEDAARLCCYCHGQRDLTRVIPATHAWLCRTGAGGGKGSGG